MKKINIISEQERKEKLSEYSELVASIGTQIADCARWENTGDPFERAEPFCSQDIKKLEDICNYLEIRSPFRNKYQ